MAFIPARPADRVSGGVPLLDGGSGGATVRPARAPPATGDPREVVYPGRVAFTSSVSRPQRGRERPPPGPTPAGAPSSWAGTHPPRRAWPTGQSGTGRSGVGVPGGAAAAHAAATASSIIEPALAAQQAEFTRRQQRGRPGPPGSSVDAGLALDPMGLLRGVSRGTGLDALPPLHTLTNTTPQTSVKLSLSSNSRVYRVDAPDDTQDFEVHLAQGVFARTDMELQAVQLADGHITPAQRTIEPAWNRVYFDMGVRVTEARRRVVVGRAGSGEPIVPIELPLPYAPITSMTSFDEPGNPDRLVRLQFNDGTQNVPLALGPLRLLEAYKTNASAPVTLTGAADDPIVLDATTVVRIEDSGAVIVRAADLTRYPALDAAAGTSLSDAPEAPLAVLTAGRPASPGDLATMLTTAFNDPDAIAELGARIRFTYEPARDRFHIQVQRSAVGLDLGTRGAGRPQRMRIGGAQTPSHSLSHLEDTLQRATWAVGGDALAAYVGLAGRSVTVAQGVREGGEWGVPRAHPEGSYLSIPPGQYDTAEELGRAIDLAGREGIWENGTAPPVDPALCVCAAPPEPDEFPVAGPVDLLLGFDIQRADAAPPATTIQVPPGAYSVPSFVEAIQAQLSAVPGLNVVVSVVTLPCAKDAIGLQFKTTDGVGLQIDFRTFGAGEAFGYPASAVVTDTLGDGVIRPTQPMPHVPVDADDEPFPGVLRVQLPADAPGKVAYVARPPPTFPYEATLGVTVLPGVGAGDSTLQYIDVASATAYVPGTPVTLIQTIGPDPTARGNPATLPGIIGEPVLPNSFRVFLPTLAAPYAPPAGVTFLFVQITTPLPLNIYTVPTAAVPCIAWPERMGFSSMQRYGATQSGICGTAALSVSDVPFVYMALFMDSLGVPLGSIYGTPDVAGGVQRVTRAALGTGNTDAGNALPRYEGALTRPRYFAVLLNRTSQYNLDFDRAFVHRFSSEDSPGSLSRVRVALFNPNHTPYVTHGTPVNVSLQLFGAFTA